MSWSQTVKIVVHRVVFITSRSQLVTTLLHPGYQRVPMWPTTLAMPFATALPRACLALTGASYGFQCVDSSNSPVLLTGRYVSIQILDNNSVLTLCGLAVKACSPPPPPPPPSPPSPPPPTCASLGGSLSSPYTVPKATMTGTQSTTSATYTWATAQNTINAGYPGNSNWGGNTCSGTADQGSTNPWFRSMTHQGKVQFMG